LTSITYRVDTEPDSPAHHGLADAPADAPPPTATRIRPRRWRGPMALLGSVVQRSIAVAALLAVWETFPRLNLVDATFLPPLSQVLQAWWDLGRRLRPSSTSIAAILLGKRGE